jgi:Carboxypeptidase regulatory-like domain/TonB dependent receptor
MKRTVVAVLLLILCFSPSLIAQSLISGDITGTVQDATGAIVPGASVTLKSASTGQSRVVATNQTGSYRFSLLQPGPYVLTVKAPGFASQSLSVTVAVGQAASADFKLAVNATVQTVEVTSESPVLQVENGNTATTFSPEMIDLMPNGGGDLTQFAQLAPGSLMNTGGGYGNFTSNGLPANTNVFTVNGTNNMDPYFNINNSGATNLTLGANEISEAAVVSNAYSGEYGQQAGAQVNYITKSGTNKYHGDAKYNWTGRSMNARDYFNESSQPKPFTNNNQWAVSAGGPVVKDKTFFFANYEGLRYILATSQAVYTPTAAFQAATLANIAAVTPSQLSLYQKTFDFYNKAAGASSATPFTTTDDSALGCGDLDVTTIGLAANTPCAQQFRSGAGQLSTEWIATGRLDHNFSDYDRAYLRYRMDRGNQATYTDPISPLFNATSNQPSYDGQLQWTHIFKSGATNQFIAGLDYYSAPFISNPAGYTAYPVNLRWNDSPFANVGGTQDNFPQGRNVTQYQFIDDFSKPKGNHTFKFGVNYRRYDVTTQFKVLTTAPRVLVYSTTDWVNGIADEFRQRFPLRTTQPVALYGLGVYGEDEWKITNNLKLTLAMRVEHNSNPVCQTNCFSRTDTIWDQLAHDSGVPYDMSLSTGIRQAFKNTDPFVVAPRIGFAWQPFGLKQTVVRGGIGLFYDAMPAGVLDTLIRNYPGFVEIRNQAGLYGANVTWAQGAPNNGWDAGSISAAALYSGYAQGLTLAQIQAQVTAAGVRFTPPSLTALPERMRTPRYQKWNLELQQGFGKSNSISINYSGSHGIFIPMQDAYANGYKASGIAPFPTTVPDARFNTVTEFNNGGVSNYHGLTVSFQRRMAQSLQFQLNYNWSHAFDTISAAGGGSFIYGNDSLANQLNPANLKAANYSSSDYDVRQNLTASFVFEPKFHEWFHAPKWIGSNWSLSGTAITHSGFPFTPQMYSTSISRGTPTYLLPIYNGPANPNCGTDAVKNPCLVASDFSAATSATGISPMRRNGFRGPGFFNMDMNVQKGFDIHGWEQGKVFLGLNAYNVFNHPNFASPASEVGGNFGPFGYITSTVSVPTSPFGSFVGAAASGRILQLSARITF